jgi:hypothetical protein
LSIGIATFCTGGFAQINLAVSVDTSALTAGTYYAEYSLSDGTVGASTANTITLGSFTVPGGSFGAILPPTLGDASGNMNTAITLADGDPGGVADLAQGFTPGSKLTWDMSVSTVVQPGTPDEFTFRLLDSGLNYLTTNDPSSNNSYLTIDITPSFVSSDALSVYSGSNVPAPIVTVLPPSSGSTPEPGSLAFIAAGGVSAAVVLRRRRKQIV